jgi:hypothetical protein
VRPPQKPTQDADGRLGDLRISIVDRAARRVERERAFAGFEDTQGC